MCIWKEDEYDCGHKMRKERIEFSCANIDIIPMNDCPYDDDPVVTFYLDGDCRGCVAAKEKARRIAEWTEDE